MKKMKARESILSTAARLFHKQGYSNTGINQITDEAGIAKSTLYLHFRSKEDLLIAYLGEAGAMTLNALREAALTGRSPEDRTLAIFEYMEQIAKFPDFYGCPFLNIVYEMSDGEERARLEIKKQKDMVRSLFADILSPLDTPELADEIYTLFEGALIAQKVHYDTWPIVAAQNIIKTIFKFFLSSN